MSLAHRSPGVKPGPAPARNSRRKSADEGKSKGYRVLSNDVVIRSDLGYELRCLVIVLQRMACNKSWLKKTNDQIRKEMGVEVDGVMEMPSLATIKRWLAELERLGYIRRERLPGNWRKRIIFFIKATGPYCEVAGPPSEGRLTDEPTTGSRMSRRRLTDEPTTGSPASLLFEDVDVATGLEDSPLEDAPAEPAGDGGSDLNPGGNVNVPETDPDFIPIAAKEPTAPRLTHRAESIADESGPPLDNVERFRQLRDRHHEKTGRWIGADLGAAGVGPIARGLAAGGDTARIWRQALGRPEPGATPGAPGVSPTQADPAEIPMPRDRDPEVDAAIPRHLEIRKRSANWPLGSTPVWQIQNVAVQDAKAEVWQRRYRAQAEHLAATSRRVPAYTQSVDWRSTDPAADAPEPNAAPAMAEAPPESQATVEPSAVTRETLPEPLTAPPAQAEVTAPSRAPAAVPAGPEASPALIGRFESGNVSTGSSGKDELIRAMMAMGGEQAAAARRHLSAGVPEREGGTLRRVTDDDRDRIVDELLERDEARASGQRDPIVSLILGLGGGGGRNAFQPCVNRVCQKFDDGHSQAWYANFFREVDAGDHSPKVALYAYAMATRPGMVNPGAVFVDAAKLCGVRPRRPLRSSRPKSSRKRGR